MPLVKARCTSCDGELQVDPSKDAAICPYCGTPYIVEKAINNYNTTVNNNFAGANVTIRGGIDADTMFENWLATTDHPTKLKLKDQFLFNYATDERCKFILAWHGKWVGHYDELENMARKFLCDSRYNRYRADVIKQIKEAEDNYNNPPQRVYKDYEDWCYNGSSTDKPPSSMSTGTKVFIAIVAFFVIMTLLGIMFG